MRETLYTCLLFVTVLCVCDPHEALGCNSALPTVTHWDVMRKHQRCYTNCQYGYAVGIPAGLIGGSQKPPAPQHGFGIILSRESQGMISVDGSHHIQEWQSIDDIVEKHVKWIEEDAQQILSSETHRVTLDGHPAARLIARFQCPDGTLMVHDMFLALFYGITYEIKLRTDAATYAEYKNIIEQMAASWQFRGPWCEVVCGNAYPLSLPEVWESGAHWGLYTGEYTNCDYGYAVTIPAEFMARGNYKSGVEMLLSRSGYLEVGGGANFLNWPSLDQAAETYVKWITLEAHTVLSSHKQAVTLGDFPAIRLIVRYECPANTPMVKDIFLVLDGENVYKVDLVAEETKYEEYRPLLEDIAETFRLTGESCE